MRQKFERLRENLNEFVEQGDYPMLVVRCLNDELAYVLTFFQALDQTRLSDYIFSFPQPFSSATGYLNGVMDNLCEQLEAAGPIREEKGLEPLPPFPDELLDQQKPPEERIFGLLMYLRGLLPDEEGHRMAIGFLPLEVEDWEGFADLMRRIMPIGEVPDWMEALRIVAWDDRGRRLVTQRIEACGTDLVLNHEIDFSTPALIDQMTRDAANPTVPSMERMACLLQLAALDYAYKRYADAVEKYGMLYAFYEEHELPSMQAMCLLGMGDVLRAIDHLPEAKERLQQGIALAIEGNALPVLLNLLLSITHVCMEQLELEEAEGYADMGTKVAAALLNVYAHCDFFELRGNAQIAQGKQDEGLGSYLQCEELCQTHRYHHRWSSVLERQVVIFERAQMRSERCDAQARLDAVHLLEQEGGHA